MTLDERLERLTERHEALTHTSSDLIGTMTGWTTRTNYSSKIAPRRRSLTTNLLEGNELFFFG